MRFRVGAIEEAIPNLWFATVTASMDRQVSGEVVSDTVEIRVRFTVSEDATAENLRSVAIREAVRCLEAVHEEVRSKSATELAEVHRRTLETQFQLPSDSED